VTPHTSCQYKIFATSSVNKIIQRHRQNKNDNAQSMINLYLIMNQEPL